MSDHYDTYRTKFIMADNDSDAQYAFVNMMHHVTPTHPDLDKLRQEYPWATKNPPPRNKTAKPPDFYYGPLMFLGTSTAIFFVTVFGPWAIFAASVINMILYVTYALLTTPRRRV